MTKFTNESEWRIVDLPRQENDIHSLVKLMNKFGNLPTPLDLIAQRARTNIYKRLNGVDKIYFDYNFFMLYGNLQGKSIWFTNTYVLDYATINFGANITIGPDCKLITSWHETENFNIVKALPISIQDNVWITLNAVVLPGVEIGENSIIGAGSIVTHSIPANVFAAGNPARPIKNIDRSHKWWEELNENIKNSSPINHTKKNKLYKLYSDIKHQLKILKKYE